MPDHIYDPWLPPNPTWRPPKAPPFDRPERPPGEPAPGPFRGPDAPTGAPSPPFERPDRNPLNGRRLWALPVAAFALAASSGLAHATGVGGGGGAAPWDTPLQNLGGWFSGNDMLLIGGIGLFIAAIIWVFSESLHYLGAGLVRFVMVLATAAGVGGAASGIWTNLGIAGATVAGGYPVAAFLLPAALILAAMVEIAAAAVRWLRGRVLAA